MRQPVTGKIFYGVIFPFILIPNAILLIALVFPVRLVVASFCVTYCLLLLWKQRTVLSDIFFFIQIFTSSVILMVLGAILIVPVPSAAEHPVMPTLQLLLGLAAGLVLGVFCNYLFFRKTRERNISLEVYGMAAVCVIYTLIAAAGIFIR
ncbi:MAG TPA: hypothetical protein PK544_06575 [Spirochaetota bacterium]|nr:hypothetical protein [Spirochaetota bacterium]HPJ37223.1 hypothetical protein [Spirochaetota bacterium]HPQ52195.1 hypothetical protein [Spirochaetota bacterium]